MSDSFTKGWYSGGIKPYRVKCKPLGTMLHEAGVKAVDFFSLDVEGGELMVLETMDWSIPVHVWVIELDASNLSKDAAVRSLLTRQGYERSTFDIRRWCPLGGDCTVNEVWVPQK